jgi:alkylhydroperoxidase/carboxymuconolactone decarboxylase family protein YurZ
MSSTEPSKPYKADLMPDPRRGFRKYRATQEARVMNNCKFTLSALIVCRHLGFSFLTLARNKARIESEDFYKIVFRSQESMSSDERLRNGFYDTERVEFRADRYLHVSLNPGSRNQIGPVLHQLFSGMGEEDKRLKMTFRSENHVMAMEIRHKKTESGESKFVVIFYDPNDTLAHIRVVCDSLKQVSSLTLGDFLTPEYERHYFPALESGVLEVYNDPIHISPEKSETERSLELLESEPLPLATLMRRGMVNQTAIELSDILKEPDLERKKLLLIAGIKLTNFCPGLYMALQNGHTETVKVYLQAVLASGLGSEDQKELIASSSSDGVPGLLMALNLGHTETVKAYLEAVLDSGLRPEDKKELIACIFSSDGVPGLCMALSLGHTETVKVYLEAVLASGLPLKDQKELFASIDHLDGTPGLYVALYNGHTETVNVYLQAVLAWSSPQSAVNSISPSHD